MTESLKSKKLKKKQRAGDIKIIITSEGGARSPRLEKKTQKAALMKSGSAYTVILARRDDKEISGAFASLNDKTLEELKEKYKKYNKTSRQVG